MAMANDKMLTVTITNRWWFYPAIYALCYACGMRLLRDPGPFSEWIVRHGIKVTAA